MKKMLIALALLILLMPAGAILSRPNATDKIWSASAPKVYLAYFSNPGCSTCVSVWNMITALAENYPNLETTWFDTRENTNMAILNNLFSAYNVPSGERNVLERWVFVGDNYLSESSITEANVRSLIEKYLQTGSEPPWEKIGACGTAIPSALSLLAMTIFAGLVDGINPCAFAVVVFFVSYLAYLGRRKREIALAGIFYIYGVFLTYLFIGLVLLFFLAGFAVDLSIKFLVKSLIVAFALTIGTVSLYDYYMFKKGKAEKAKLRLPRVFSKRIHSIIRGTRKTSFIVPFAFIVGGGVSFFEFACTGQVLFPYLAMLATWGLPHLYAFFYMILYTIMFILPLVAVFLLASYGIRSQRLAEVLRRRTGTTKILLAVVLFVLAAFLLVFR